MVKIKKWISVTFIGSLIGNLIFKKIIKAQMVGSTGIVRIIYNILLLYFNKALILFFITVATFLISYLKDHTDYNE